MPFIFLDSKRSVRIEILYMVFQFNFLLWLQIIRKIGYNAICVLALLHLVIAVTARDRDSLRMVLNLETRADKLFYLNLEMANSFYFSSQLDSFDHYVKQMFVIATALGVDSISERSYNFMSDNFSAHNDYTNSLKCLEKAIYYCKKGPPFRSLSFYYKDIGANYKKLNNYEIAKHYLLKSILLAKEENQDMERQYTHLSEVYLGLNQLDSAYYTIQKAVQLNPDTTDIYGQARIYSVYGRVLTLRREYKLAASYFETCHQMVHKHNINSNLLDYEKYFSELLIEMNDLPYAKSVLEEGIQRAKLINDFDYVASLILLKVKLSQHSNIDKSYEFALDYNEIKAKSIDHTNRQKVFSDALSFFIINQQNEANHILEVKRRNLLLGYLACVVIIITAFLIFFVLSKNAIVTERVVINIGMVILVMLFEFIYVLIFPFLSHYLEGNQMLLVISLVCISGIVIPIHHRVEHTILELLRKKNLEAHSIRAQSKLSELQGYHNE